MKRSKEAELTEHLKRGDRAARQVFYESYAPRIMTLCRRYASKDAEAEDLLQNTFVKAFSKIRSFEWRGEGSLQGWLARIALNEALTTLRRRINSEPEESVADIPEEEPEEITSLSAEQILECLRMLPDSYRTVFNMFVFEEMSHSEIGRLLGIKENSSASRYSRARKMLAKIITERYGYPSR